MESISDEPRLGKPRCGARRRDGTGESCRKGAGAGTDHPGEGRCALHGGKTPSHRVKAQVAAATQAVKTYGLPLDVSPTEALLNEVKWTAGHVAWLRERVQELEAEALAWGKTSEVDKGATEFVGVDTTHAAAVNLWVELYQKERKHLLDVCKAALSAGVEERRVRLAEQQGALLASVIRAVLDDLNLSPEQQMRVTEIVPRRLRAVSGSIG